MTKPLSGIYVALLSGFADDGAFDPVRQQNIVDHVVRQRVTWLYVGGSSAEAALMTADELQEQQAVVLERARGRVPRMIAHVGQPSLRESVRLAKHAAGLGYDALSALPPHAFAFEQGEILAYYRELAEATELPLIVYEVPARTGHVAPLDTMARILSLVGVVGIKFTSTDLYVLSRIKKRCPDATIFFGCDEMYGAAAALSVDGGIGTTYNIVGNLYAAIHEAVEAGDIARLRALQAISQDLVESIMQVGVIPGTKKGARARRGRLRTGSRRAWSARSRSRLDHS